MWLLHLQEVVKVQFSLFYYCPGGIGGENFVWDFIDNILTPRMRDNRRRQ